MDKLLDLFLDLLLKFDVVEVFYNLYSRVLGRFMLRTLGELNIGYTGAREDESNHNKFFCNRAKNH